MKMNLSSPSLFSAQLRVRGFMTIDELPNHALPLPPRFCYVIPFGHVSCACIQHFTLANSLNSDSISST